jgi:hypothetical protein
VKEVAAGRRRNPMIGLRFRLWKKGNRGKAQEIGPVSLNELELARQASASLRFADKRGNFAGRPACESCIFDPAAEYVIRI